MKKSRIKLFLGSILLAIMFAFTAAMGTQKAYASDEDSDVVDNAKRGVYRVLCVTDDESFQWGSAFVVSKEEKDGKEVENLITNRHVVTDDEGKQVDKIYLFKASNALKLSYDYYAFVNPNTGYIDKEAVQPSADLDYGRMMSCDLVYCSPNDEADFAVIKTIEKLESCNVLPLLSADTLKSGQGVYALGFPTSSDSSGVKMDENDDYTYVGQSEDGYYVYKRHYADMSMDGSASGVTSTWGKISKLTTLVDENNVKIIQSEADINSGNSGGPLITEKGAVVGINTYSFGEDAERNAAIYIDYVIDKLDDLKIDYTTYSEESSADESVIGSSIVSEIDPDPEPDNKGLPTWVFILIAAAVILVVIIVIVIIVMNGKKEPQHDPSPKKFNDDPRPIPIDTRKPVVISLSSQHNNAAVSVANKKIIIGRDPETCSILYRADTKGVSRRHCSVSYDAGRNCFLVTDLNSTYGTYLANGKRLDPGVEYPLQPSDLFYIGDSKNGLVLQVELK